jgi:hypothetical protein
MRSPIACAMTDLAPAEPVPDLQKQLSDLLAIAVERGWTEAADWLVDRI